MKRKETTRPLSLTLAVSCEPEDLFVPENATAVVEKAVFAALSYEKAEGPIEVSLTYCNGAYIRELNAQHRQKDSETDVLSFPLFDEEEEDPIEEEGAMPIGDIVINVDRAAKQAEEIGHSTLREIAFLSIHSTLHLLGYDHERSQKDDEEMCRRQREILDTLPKDLF